MIRIRPDQMIKVGITESNVGCPIAEPDFDFALKDFSSANLWQIF